MMPDVAGRGESFFVGAAGAIGYGARMANWSQLIKPGVSYREQDGILWPAQSPEIAGQNQKYQKFYDKVAGLYDLWEIVYAGLTHGGRDSARHDLLKPLTVKPGDKVLEVSIGTGVNLRYLPKEAEYYGLDISGKMLRRCWRNMPKWDRAVTLFHGVGEDLPFADGAFDVVFHIGGLNFFSDPSKAVAEMIRVAKSGALVMYGDETEKMVREVYAKTPMVGKYYQEHVGEQPAPLSWLPAGIKPTYEIILKGNFYLVHFRKG